MCKKRSNFSKIFIQNSFYHTLAIDLIERYYYEKISLVTGGGGMLGLQHASALLEIGYVVVLVDINDRSLKKFF